MLEGPIKPYRINARIKNNRLLTALEETFQTKVQGAIAEKLRIGAGELGKWINMKVIPFVFTKKAGFRWRSRALFFAELTAIPVEELFDPKFYGNVAVPVQIEYVPPESLEQVPLLEDRERIVEQSEAKIITEGLMALTPREEIIVRLRIEESLTFSEVGAKVGLSEERVRQIEGRGLRKIRAFAARKGMLSREI